MGRVFTPSASPEPSLCPRGVNLPMPPARFSSITGHDEMGVFRRAQRGPASPGVLATDPVTGVKVPRSAVVPSG